MKISYAQWIERLNSRLLEFGQVTRVIEFGLGFLVLSTGHRLSGNDFTKFKKRVMNSRTHQWVSNIDSLLAGTCTEKEIKSLLSAAGGRVCQIKHGSKIRKNLNTGRSWNAGTQGQAIGSLGPRPQSVKDAIARKNSGAGNGMYGKSMSDKDKKYRSRLMQSRILEGTFTPNSNNRNTHWQSTLDGIRYRSSWETLYQYHVPTACYEKLRIEYQFEGANKVYIVDFVDYENKTVAEIKPKELCCGSKFDAKIKALRDWSQLNGFQLNLVDQTWLCNHPEPCDYTRFDASTARKIRKIYEAGKKNRD